MLTYLFLKMVILINTIQDIRKLNIMSGCKRQDPFFVKSIQDLRGCSNSFNRIGSSKDLINDAQ